MTKLNTAAVLIALTALWPSPARAGCVCTCVDGSNQAVCDSSLDITPICPPALCPIDAPSLRPLQPLGLPPLGTETCEMTRVLNPSTRAYEWRNLCR